MNEFTTKHRGTAIFHKGFPGKLGSYAQQFGPISSATSFQPAQVSSVINTNKFVSSPHVDEVAPARLNAKELSSDPKDEESKEVLKQPIVFEVISIILRLCIYVTIKCNYL